MNREWGIPIALGLVVAAGLWALPDGDGDGPADDGHQPSTTGPSAAPPTVLTPFNESLGVAGAEARFIVVAPQGEAAAMAFLNGSGFASQAAELDWRGGNEQRGVPHKLAFYELEHAGGECARPVRCGPLGDTLSPLPKAYSLAPEEVGPRFGEEGYNATRATVYVFDSRGLLLFTNDPPGNWSEFQGPPTQFDAETWYLGDNGTAPEGTEPVPEFARPLLPQLRPVLQGVPVGGVVSAQSNAYASYFGTVFITARIDALTYAP